MKVREGSVFELPSDGAPRYVSVDYGSSDYTVECEYERLKDGTVRILDFREVSMAAGSAGRKT